MVVVSFQVGLKVAAALRSALKGTVQSNQNVKGVFILASFGFDEHNKRCFVCLLLFKEEFCIGPYVFKCIMQCFIEYTVDTDLRTKCFSAFAIINQYFSIYMTFISRLFYSEVSLLKQKV